MPDAARPNDEEWRWLTGHPDANPFLGFFPGPITTPDRLLELWEMHEEQIRAEWGDSPPEIRLFGHPLDLYPD